MTSYWRRCDVITSHRRQYVVIFTSCSRWELSLEMLYIYEHDWNFHAHVFACCTDNQQSCLYIRDFYEIYQIKSNRIFRSLSPILKIDEVSHRVKTNPPIFASCRECPPYLASAETIRNVLLVFFLRLPFAENGFLPRQSASLCFLPRLSEESRITRKVSTGIYLACIAVSAGKKRSRTVSVEAKYKYDRQSRQEAKTGGLVYNL